MPSVFKITEKRVAKAEKRARIDAGESGSDVESSADELSDEDGGLFAGCR